MEIGLKIFLFQANGIAGFDGLNLFSMLSWVKDSVQCVTDRVLVLVHYLCSLFSLLEEPSSYVKEYGCRE
jgi:hypothetical protein